MKKINVDKINVLQDNLYAANLQGHHFLRSATIRLLVQHLQGIFSLPKLYKLIFLLESNFSAMNVIMISQGIQSWHALKQGALKLF